MCDTGALRAFDDCMRLAKSIDNVLLRTTAVRILEENKDDLLICKGSNWQHHNFCGGLIKHMYSVMSLSISVAKEYKDRISMDILKFSALFHDIGKVFDYSRTAITPPNMHISAFNQELLGHAYEGASYVGRILREEYVNLEQGELTTEYFKLMCQCEHCILTHMEPTKQKMLEATIIGHIDTIDAFATQTSWDRTNEEYVIEDIKFQKPVRL